MFVSQIHLLCTLFQRSDEDVLVSFGQSINFEVPMQNDSRSFNSVKMTLKCLPWTRWRNVTFLSISRAVFL